MKKIIVFSVFILFGCSSNLNDEINPLKNDYSSFIERVNKGLFLKATFNLGIEKIIPKKSKDGEITLSFSSSPKEFANEVLDMSSYTFRQKRKTDSYILSLENSNRAIEPLHLS